MNPDEVLQHPVRGPYVAYFQTVQRLTASLVNAITSMSELFGSEVVQLLERISSDPEMGLVHLESNNQAIVELVIPRLQAGTPLLDQARLARLAEQIVEPLRIQAMIRVADSKFARSNPVGLALLELVDVVIQRSDWADRKNHLRTVILSPPENAVDVSAGLLAQKAGTDFGAQSRAACQQLATLAETQYKGGLRASLLLWRLAKWSSQKIANGLEVSNLLGKVVDECRVVWGAANSPLSSLLVDNLVACRNSEMHRSTIRDLTTKTITFVNVETGTQTPPLSVDEFGLLSLDTMAAVGLMQAVFRSAAGIP